MTMKKSIHKLFYAILTLSLINVYREFKVDLLFGKIIKQQYVDNNLLIV